MPKAKEMEFEALSLLNRVSRDLGLSTELQESCQKHVSKYYSGVRNHPSLPPIVVASILYYLSEQFSEPLSVRAVTGACKISTRWFEKKREEILKEIT
ncbi:MAG: cyclin family protein [Candidatus Hodarchaeales archaeon]